MHCILRISGLLQTPFDIIVHAKFFIHAGEEISIADLMCLCQITQYWISDFNLEDHGANVKRWVEDCQKTLNPHFDKVHQVVYDCRKAGTFKTTYDI